MYTLKIVGQIQVSPPVVMDRLLVPIYFSSTSQRMHQSMRQERICPNGQIRWRRNKGRFHSEKSESSALSTTSGPACSELKSRMMLTFCAGYCRMRELKPGVPPPCVRERGPRNHPYP